MGFGFRCGVRTPRLQWLSEPPYLQVADLSSGRTRPAPFAQNRLDTSGRAPHVFPLTMGNLKKKRRLKMNKHKRRKRLKSNRHKKRTWQK